LRTACRPYPNGTDGDCWTGEGLTDGYLPGSPGICHPPASDGPAR